MRTLASVLAVAGGNSHADTRLDNAIPPAISAADAMRSTGEDLYLEVELNGSPTGRLQHFVHRGTGLCMKAGDLRSFGFTIGDAAEEVCLADLAGVQYRYDEQLQRIAIQGDGSVLKLPTNVLNLPDRKASPPTSSTGVVVNYDVYAAQGSGQDTLSGLVELRAFAPFMGVLSTTSLTRRLETPDDGWHGDTVRLDTQWRLAFPDTALALTVGDTFTGSVSWSRATRIGGISFGTDFAVQPYRVTTPLPQFFGQATAPSAVELYVDGIRQYRGNVPAGPFQLSAVPGIDAGGQAQVVLTDALGRSSTVTFPVYSARQLLRAGLDDWSVDLGVVRENYGIGSFDYGHAPVASGTWRRGASDDVTIETHAETGDGRTAGGAGIIWAAGGANIFNASLSASRGGGGQLGVGYTWTGQRFNVALDSLRSNNNYRDVASGYGAPPPRISERLLVGMNLHRASVGANLVRLQYAGERASRYAGVFLLDSLGDGASWNLSYNRNIDRVKDQSIFLGLTLNPDARTTLTVSAERNGDRSNGVVDASQPVDGDGGFGWHVQGRTGPSGGGLAEVGWLGNRGQLTVGASNIGTGSYAYADANGALVLMGGHAFAARRIDDAFALVTTEGVANIPVLLENRRTGVTDADGMLLVSRLNAYQDNRLAIDPLDLPADARVERVESLVAPSDRAGVVVRFPIKSVRGVSLVLRDEAGKPLPVGSRIDGAEAAIVGYDGIVYLENLQGPATLHVRKPDHATCSVALPSPPPAGASLTCRDAPR
jgi:outer membrane usher protein